MGIGGKSGWNAVHNNSLGVVAFRHLSEATVIRDKQFIVADPAKIFSFDDLPCSREDALFLKPPIGVQVNHSISAHSSLIEISNLHRVPTVRGINHCRTRDRNEPDEEKKTERQATKRNDCD